MSFWIFVSSRAARRGSGVDAKRYLNIHDLASYANTALERGFGPGSTWLKQRFPAKSFVAIYVRAHGDTTVKVEKPRLKSDGGGPGDPKEISCSVNLPAVWFDAPGDGLLAVRVFRAVLLALRAVGEHYEIGPPPLRSGRADPGKPELRSLFSPPQVGPSPFRAAAASLQSLADAAEPHQLLLAAREPATRSVRARRNAVVTALGSVQAEHVLPVLDEGDVRVWVIRQHH
jgi:hypothetical protein